MRRPVPQPRAALGLASVLRRPSWRPSAGEHVLAGAAMCWIRDRAGQWAARPGLHRAVPPPLRPGDGSMCLSLGFRVRMVTRSAWVFPRGPPAPSKTCESQGKSGVFPLRKDMRSLLRRTGQRCWKRCRGEGAWLGRHSGWAAELRAGAGPSWEPPAHPSRNCPMLTCRQRLSHVPSLLPFRGLLGFQGTSSELGERKGVALLPSPLCSPSQGPATLLRGFTLILRLGAWILTPARTPC